ncbi:hypothetical protein ACI798_04695 [Geodermatophilus sp. SYSU D01045]
MTVPVHHPAGAWAATHRMLIAVIAVLMAAAVTVGIVLLVQLSSDEPVTGTTPPAEPAVEDTGGVPPSVEVCGNLESVAAALLC